MISCISIAVHNSTIAFRTLVSNEDNGFLYINSSPRYIYSTIAFRCHWIPEYLLAQTFKIRSISMSFIEVKSNIFLKYRLETNPPCPTGQGNKSHTDRTKIYLVLKNVNTCISYTYRYVCNACTYLGYDVILQNLYSKQKQELIRQEQEYAWEHI